MSCNLGLGYKLLDLGMLIDDEVDELDLIKKRYEKAKFHNKRLYLMLYPTQNGTRSMT